MHTVCLVIMRILLKTSLENMHTEIGDVFWFHLWEAVSFQDPSMGMGTNHQYQITSLPFLRLNIEVEGKFLVGMFITACTRSELVYRFHWFSP